jgi:hypothetical protein
MVKGRREESNVRMAHIGAFSFNEVALRFIDLYTKLELREQFTITLDSMTIPKIIDHVKSSIPPARNRALTTTWPQLISPKKAPPIDTQQRPNQ